MSTRLLDFFKFNVWANLRMLEACSKLSDAQLDATALGTYGSIRETLTHMIRSEEGYARHFNFSGPAPTPPLKEFTTFPGFDELRRRAERSGKELAAMAEQADLSAILHLDDGTYDAPVIVLLIQAVDHGIDHRSQIATMMSLQGVTPPELDAWNFAEAAGMAGPVDNK